MSRPLLIAAMMLGLAATPSVAEACSCLAPSLPRSWHESSDTVQATILSSKLVGDYYYYRARVLRPFSGCTRAGDEITVRTHRSEATCGTRLWLGTWLLTSQVTVTDQGPVYDINLCGFNRPWASVSAIDRYYLANRQVYCPLDGELRCADGSEPVECYADPCSVETCASAAICEANFCSGCTAEFYDRSWTPVCTPW